MKKGSTQLPQTRPIATPPLVHVRDLLRPDAVPLHVLYVLACPGDGTLRSVLCSLKQHDKLPQSTRLMQPWPSRALLEQVSILQRAASDVQGRALIVMM